MKLIEKHIAITAVVGFFAVSVLLSVGSFFLFHQKVFRARVLGVSVESMTEDQAQKTLSESLTLPESIDIVVQTPDSKEIFNIKPEEISAQIDINQTVSDVYNYPRTGGLAQRTRKVLSAVFSPYESEPVIQYDSQKLEEYLSIIAGQVYLPPNYPDINTENNTIVISKGNLGREVNINRLKEQFIDRLSKLSSEQITINTVDTGATLSATQVEEIEQQAELTKNKSIKLLYEDFEYQLSEEQILELVFGINGTEGGPYQALFDELSEKIEIDASSPVFIENEGKVTEFTPATNGIAINKDSLKTNLESEVLGVATATQSAQVNIPVNITEPDISTEDVNNYGIKELIGYGESYYKGSISSRVHNVALAASKFNGVLIAPGEVFSFNDTVGDISALTGFKQSYIIKGNETVLGDGGGVCQVSTTLFRTALDAGLEIVERRPHSYRVSYYEQDSPPGLDATIYSPTVDLKIRNDTGNHILIQTKVINNNKLVFEFYGTSDGRVATLTEPVITEVTPAPEDLFIDDPTLPAGEIKQIDYKNAGAKVYFDYKVSKNGEVLFKKTFYSNYRPWQAKFLRGTG